MQNEPLEKNIFRKAVLSNPKNTFVRSTLDFIFLLFLALKKVLFSCFSLAERTFEYFVTFRKMELGYKMKNLFFLFLQNKNCFVFINKIIPWQFYETQKYIPSKLLLIHQSV